MSCGLRRLSSARDGLWCGVSSSSRAPTSYCVLVARQCRCRSDRLGLGSTPSCSAQSARGRLDDCTFGETQLGARWSGGAGRPRCCAWSAAMAPAGALLLGLALRNAGRSLPPDARDPVFAISRSPIRAAWTSRSCSNGFDLDHLPPGSVPRHRRANNGAGARQRSPSCSAGFTIRKKARSKSMAPISANSISPPGARA